MTFAIETDKARIQEIRNSISEGQAILRAGKKSGKSTQQLWAIRMAVEHSLAKLGESRIFKPEFKVVDVTPAGY